MAQIWDVRVVLTQKAVRWRDGCSYLMRILQTKSMKLGEDEDLEVLLVALDFNKYYSEAR
jgi:hypothetical protein